MKFEKKKVSDEIPTSSMADITFLLIIFFMVTNTFSAGRGLDFAVPKDDKNQTTVEKQESVLLTIHAGGRFEADGKSIQLGEILDYLKPKLERDPTKPVIIRPDPDAAYGDMVRVFDQLRLGESKGITVKNISIPTQREIDQFWY